MTYYYLDGKSLRTSKYQDKSTKFGLIAKLNNKNLNQCAQINNGAGTMVHNERWEFKKKIKLN